MTTEPTLTVRPETAEEQAHDGSDVHEVTVRQYIIIALMLAILTAVEIAISYLDTGPFEVPLLLILMVIKFFTVVGYFMHLKFDNRLFGAMFYTGLVLAVLLYTAVLTTFHFFAS
ncbi:MAG: cytochrome C oxidase subunit IV family protein [Ilumatobacteraceae bacterium]